MRSPPFSVIATWPRPNYVDPVTRGPTLLIVESIMLSLAWIFLSLRLYVRLVILRRSWWDDWVMLIATIFNTGVTACVILATTRYGWNLHVWDLKPHQMIAGRQISIAGQTIFLFANNLAKLSILISYLRIAGPGTKFRLLTKVTMGYVILIHWIFLIVLWTQCLPSYYYWTFGDSGHHCEDEGPPLMGQISTNIAADVFVYVLPMATLAKLKLPLNQRIALMVVFGFGSIVVLAACMRLYYTHHTVYETYDVTWSGYHLWIWTAIESNLGIICGCAPALKPLVYKAKTHITSYSQKINSNSFGDKRRSYHSGNRSTVQAPGQDMEMNGTAKLVGSKNSTDIEKTIEWEVVNESSSPKSSQTEAQHSWLDDADEPEKANRQTYASTTEITKSSFGLKK